MGACKSKENVTEAGKKTDAPAPEKAAEGGDAAKAEAPAAEPAAAEAPAAGGDAAE